jgi:hypothetical protein
MIVALFCFRAPSSRLLPLFFLKKKKRKEGEEVERRTNGYREKSSSSSSLLMAMRKLSRGNTNKETFFPTVAVTRELGARSPDNRGENSEK